MDRYTAGHRRGVACAPHFAAADAGRAILAEGANALEAMVAMAATIAVVYPHMAQMGGDGFWLVREPSGRRRALMAAGRSGANARRELYRDYETIPPRGALAALTVPGAIAGWLLALEAASAHDGRMRLRDLLAAAIAHAKAGAIVTRGQARLTAETLVELKDIPGFAQVFLVDGKAAAAGATLKQPLSVALEAGDVFNTPPPTQGLASLIILALFERLRVSVGENFDHIHGLIEATKRAFAVRDRVITDPDRLLHPVERY